MYVRISQAGLDAFNKPTMVPKKRVHNALYLAVGQHPIDRKQLVTTATRIIEMNGGVPALGREFSRCRSEEAAARFLVRWLVGERGMDSIKKPLWEILPE